MSSKPAPIPMPQPTSCPNFEEHCANRQSAATEYYDLSNEESPEDQKAIEEQLRGQLHSASKLIHLLHIEIDDRREINELDIEKMWFLADAIKGTMKKFDDMLMYSNVLEQFLERHRELAMKREQKEASQTKWQARRHAVLEFCHLTSFVADVKRKMGKGKGKDDDGYMEVSAFDKHEVCCKEISAREKNDDYDKHETVKTDTRADSAVCCCDGPDKLTDNITEAPKEQQSINIDVDVPRISRHISQPQLFDSAKLKPKPLILKGPIQKPVLDFSGSGGSDEYDTALQVVKKNATHINHQRRVLERKLDDLVSGNWRVGFRSDLRKRGVLPFSPTR
ncbi:hypothetical protein HDK77DRAFT_486161 [Phyllosticta capitalensis]